jgi:MoxR-like ATPase
MDNPDKPAPEAFESRLDLNEFQADLAKVQAQISRFIVGQKKAIELLQVALIADGHVLIEGVPGIAKTQMAKLMARSLSLDFSRIQFTPDLMPSDILGTAIYNQKNGDFEFKAGPIFSQIVLVDEINRSPAKTQAALFEVMEEKQVTNDGKRYVMKEPYMVLATQNPIEQEGTYRLPEAQLDRFLFKIYLDYPSDEEELDILKLHLDLKQKPEQLVEAVLSGEQILKLREVASMVHIEEDTLKYIAAIVGATRNNRSLYLGASPRASIALLKSGRAFAAMQNRDFVSPEDIRYLAPAVLAHRVILSPEQEMEGVSAYEFIQQLVKAVQVPGA